MKRIITVLSFLAGMFAYSQHEDLVLNNYPNANVYYYLKPFEQNKAYYIGKPFSVLLNDLVQYKPLQVYSSPGEYNRFIVPGSMFGFTYCGEIQYKYSITMSIRWQNNVPWEQAKSLILANDYFTDADAAFYGQQIVGDIYVSMALWIDATEAPAKLPCNEENTPDLPYDPPKTNPRDNPMPIYQGNK